MRGSIAGLVPARKTLVFFLTLLFSSVAVIPGSHKFLFYGVPGNWGLGFLIWLVLFVRYKMQMVIFKRRMALLSHEERERMLDGIPEPRRKKLREYPQS